MKIIETDIVIKASPENVWTALSDFARYPQWNPFIRQISGTIAAGARLAVLIVPPGGKPTNFRPMVLTARPGEELRWIGQLGLPGFIDGDHAFRIEQAGSGQVRFRQSEQFRGILLPLLPRSLFEQIRRGFEAMNQALKKTVETLPGE